MISACNSSCSPSNVVLSGMEPEMEEWEQCSLGWEDSGRKSTPQFLALTSHTRFWCKISYPWCKLQNYSPPPYILAIHTKPSCHFCCAKHSWMLRHNLLHTKNGIDLFKQTESCPVAFHPGYKSVIMSVDALLWSS